MTLSLADLNELRRCDWVIADVTGLEIEAMAAFLYGQSMPVLRTRRGTDQAQASAVEGVLFGDLTVGYRKDVTRWSTEPELRNRLAERLDVIAQPADLVGDQKAATAYFRSATKREEPVFLSYAGEDATVGEQFDEVLNRHFSYVFNYRDKKSLRIGEPWQDQLAESSPPPQSASSSSATRQPEALLPGREPPALRRRAQRAGETPPRQAGRGAGTSLHVRTPVRQPQPGDPGRDR